MFHLIAALNEGRKSEESFVDLPKSALEELRLWATTDQKLSLGSLKVTGVKAECYSDASGEYIAAKAFDRAVCGPVPEQYG